MELGEKLRLARQEAGLSQRALCADRITRNMLSQIEHGTAKPSMQTLQYLAERLEKPVSYFLGEAAVTPNQVAMGKARQAYGQKNYREALLALDAYVSPDESLDWERGLLGSLCCLGQAEQACKHTWFYQSVIGTGYLAPVEDREEKKHALSCIMAHYRKDRAFSFIDEQARTVAVFCLTVDQMTAKEHV